MRSKPAPDPADAPRCFLPEAQPPPRRSTRRSAPSGPRPVARPWACPRRARCPPRPRPLAVALPLAAGHNLVAPAASTQIFILLIVLTARPVHRTAQQIRVSTGRPRLRRPQPDRSRLPATATAPPCERARNSSPPRRGCRHQPRQLAQRHPGLAGLAQRGVQPVVREPVHPGWLCPARPSRILGGMRRSARSSSALSRGVHSNSAGKPSRTASSKLCRRSYRARGSSSASIGSSHPPPPGGGSASTPRPQAEPRLTRPDRGCRPRST